MILLANAFTVALAYIAFLHHLDHEHVKITNIGENQITVEADYYKFTSSMDIVYLDNNGGMHTLSSGTFDVEFQVLK